MKRSIRRTLVFYDVGVFKCKGSCRRVFSYWYCKAAERAEVGESKVNVGLSTGAERHLGDCGPLTQTLCKCQSVEACSVMSRSVTFPQQWEALLHFGSCGEVWLLAAASAAHWEITSLLGELGNRIVGSDLSHFERGNLISQKMEMWWALKSSRNML